MDKIYAHKFREKSSGGEEKRHTNEAAKPEVVLDTCCTALSEFHCYLHEGHQFWRTSEGNSPSQGNLAVMVDSRCSISPGGDLVQSSPDIGKL